MFKIIKDNTGNKVVVNTDNIEAIAEVEDMDTQITFISGEKIFVKESIDLLMPLLGIRTGTIPPKIKSSGVS